MNKKEIEELKSIIKEVEKDYDFNDFICNWIDDDDLKELETEELRDYLDELNEDGEITDVEGIYFSNAIEYLKENDASLMESMELARDFGYTTENITSEILASLLKIKRQQEYYGEFIYRVIERFK